MELLIAIGLYMGLILVGHAHYKYYSRQSLRAGHSNRKGLHAFGSLMHRKAIFILMKIIFQQTTTAIKLTRC